MAVRWGAEDAARYGGGRVMGKFFRIRIFGEAALGAFATDEAYGSVPTRTLGFTDGVVSTLSHGAPGPGHTGFVRVTNVHHSLTPTNAVTYRLYIYSSNDGAANSRELESDKIYDSTEHAVNCIAATEYLREVDRTTFLTDHGTLHYVIDWSAAPGNTAGYIEVCGERDD